MAAMPLTRFERILFNVALLIAGAVIVLRLAAIFLASYLHHAR
jgi:hypothetical protein